MKSLQADVKNTILTWKRTEIYWCQQNFRKVLLYSIKTNKFIAMWKRNNKNFKSNDAKTWLPKLVYCKFKVDDTSMYLKDNLHSKGKYNASDRKVLNLNGIRAHERCLEFGVSSVVYSLMLFLSIFVCLFEKKCTHIRYFNTRQRSCKQTKRLYKIKINILPLV